jgi:hypothetical protein
LALASSRTFAARIEYDRSLAAAKKLEAAIVEIVAAAGRTA